jgi:Fic family protein
MSKKLAITRTKRYKIQSLKYKCWSAKMAEKLYDSPHQFEPLMPSSRHQQLFDKAANLTRAASALGGSAHTVTRAAIRELVRAMNSYYSNRIEGQGTHPLNIERALRHEFSAQPAIAHLQKVALAHIEAERELEARITAGESALSSKFLTAAHYALYSRLAPGDRTTEDGRVVAPGEIRAENVEVGNHLPPDHASVPRFLHRMDEVYDRPLQFGQHLIAVACAHHRSAWVHPFLDGNGRAARLQSHCALWPLSDGLWSPSRGLARSQKAYYATLNNADRPRRGDLDGRGNLTEAGLCEWVDFFLDICADQVRFMGNMLDLDNIRRRIEALITFRAVEDKAIRREAILPLHHVFAAGPITRGEFSQMTGLGERTARTIISRLLKTGLLQSDSTVAPVRFGLPLDALQFLFPDLYPEAATQPD